MTNEIDHPYVVELAVGRDGLDFDLGRRINTFTSRDTFSCDMDEQFLQAGAKSIIVGAFPIY